MLFAVAGHADPRPAPPLGAAEIRLGLEKLQVMGSVLFVAAHPDDENTALLTWLSKGRKVRAAYLSLTRGDGGQNLIGPETGELLGVIRTQELLSARRVDGAEQFFTRASDFGYSKNADETLATWGRERILSDVVWVIRSFRPDVIVTRFPTDGRGGHGHHTSSAILAEEAFAAAADSTRFPEQLQHVRPWRARRLVWNVFRFGGAGPDTTPGRLTVDLGEYAPLLGRSFTEIAGESRSMHKSQGFGAAERRGTWTNSLEHRLGEPARGDLLDGVNLGWSRVRGGERVGAVLRRALREFRPGQPETILPLLLEARTAMAALPAEPLVERKRAELDDVIRSCAGLWIEAIALAPAATPGSQVRIATSVLNRTRAEVAVEQIELLGAGGRPSGSRNRAAARALLNAPVNDTLLVEVPADAQPSVPYWLERERLPGAFEVGDPLAIGSAENGAAFRARFRLSLQGRKVAFDVPVVHRWIDPVQGERHRDFVIVPPATLRFERGVHLFPPGGTRDMRVAVRAASRPVTGRLRLELPAGWRSQPGEAALELPANADTLVRFAVTAAGGPALAATVRARLESGGRSFGWQQIEIDYPHIAPQSVLLPAGARLVRAEVSRGGGRVAYLMGSGDEVPAALREMGFTVTLLDDEAVESADLSGFDAIVTGVRAYNTRPRLRRSQRRLLDYVADGGRLVVQYNTAEAELQDRLGPFPFRISRERVTAEDAEMRLLVPDHPLLGFPNRITADDFRGWVQERGLYYASPWDPRYQPLLSANDPGEPPRDGGLLYARHGRGEFLYTGLAFFRQLPAGVPGAWRLFANLVSRGGAGGAGPAGSRAR